MDDTSKSPRIIWFLWLQGMEKAPAMVQECHLSWVKVNPDWEVKVVTHTNLSELLPTVANQLQAGTVSKQALSDIVRINLLKEYGGVWVDASLFCTRPLDEWLASAISTGWFAFMKPTRGKLISSWFLAATPGNYIVEQCAKAVNEYWSIGGEAPLLLNRFYQKFCRLFVVFGLDIVVRWSFVFTKKYVGLYPYFWFHYLFEIGYKNDCKFAQVWDDTPKVLAALPHTLLFSGLREPVTTELKEFIRDGRYDGAGQKTQPDDPGCVFCGVHKLQWQQKLPAPKDSTLEYLLQSNHSRYGY